MENSMLTPDVLPDVLLLDPALVGARSATCCRFEHPLLLARLALFVLNIAC